MTDEEKKEIITSQVKEKVESPVIIPVPEISTGSVTVKGDVSTKIDNLDGNIKTITWVLVVIVATCLFTLGAISNDYLASKQATYQSLVDKVNILVEQNKVKSNTENEVAKPPMIINNYYPDPKN